MSTWRSLAVAFCPPSICCRPLTARSRSCATGLALARPLAAVGSGLSCRYPRHFWNKHPTSRLLFQWPEREAKGSRGWLCFSRHQFLASRLGATSPAAAAHESSISRLAFLSKPMPIQPLAAKVRGNVCPCWLGRQDLPANLPGPCTRARQSFQGRSRAKILSATRHYMGRAA